MRQHINSHSNWLDRLVCPIFYNHDDDDKYDNTYDNDMQVSNNNQGSFHHHNHPSIIHK